MSDPQTDRTPEPEPDEGAAVSAPEPDEANPDAEPVEPIEGPGEPAGEPTEESDEEAAEDETVPDGDEIKARAQDEKAIEVRYQKLGSENVRHAKRVNEIMQEDATSLIQCPVCMDGIAGWIYPPDVAPLQPEAVARIRTVIGLPDYTTFKNATDAQTCPECDGLGETITGSHVPGYETKTCARCNKTGYVLVTQTTNGNATLTEVPQLTGPTVYGHEVSIDPEVQHLRERGFTVIPPMQPVAGT